MLYGPQRLPIVVFVRFNSDLVAAEFIANDLSILENSYHAQFHDSSN